MSMHIENNGVKTKTSADKKASVQKKRLKYAAAEISLWDNMVGVLPFSNSRLHKSGQLWRLGPLQSQCRDLWRD